jgi:hypothetical protein
MYNFRDFPHIIWRVFLIVEKKFAAREFSTCIINMQGYAHDI